MIALIMGSSGLEIAASVCFVVALIGWALDDHFRRRTIFLLERNLDELSLEMKTARGTIGELDEALNLALEQRNQYGERLQSAHETALKNEAVVLYQKAVLESQFNEYRLQAAITSKRLAEEIGVLKADLSKANREPGEICAMIRAALKQIWKHSFVSKEDNGEVILLENLAAVRGLAELADLHPGRNGKAKT